MGVPRRWMNFLSLKVPSFSSLFRIRRKIFPLQSIPSGQGFNPSLAVRIRFRVENRLTMVALDLE